MSTGISGALGSGAMVSRAPVVRRVTLLGPAFIAPVAYVDPGNVATNVTAGSRFGYTLVWVVVMANVMAVLVQYLSAAGGMVILGMGDLRGQSSLVRVIVGFLALIAVGFLAGLFVNAPEPGPLARGLVPTFEGADSVLLASGIIGATVAARPPRSSAAQSRSWPRPVRRWPAASACRCRC